MTPQNRESWRDSPRGVAGPASGPRNDSTKHGVIAGVTAQLERPAAGDPGMTPPNTESLRVLLGLGTDYPALRPGMTPPNTEPLRVPVLLAPGAILPPARPPPHTEPPPPAPL